jgi:hypothetical protein
MEVIIVDDSDNDKTAKILKGYPKIKVIKNSERVSQAQARNQGVAVSSGRYILFLDDDVVLVRKDSVSNSVKVLKNDRTVGAVGGMIWGKDFRKGNMVVSAPMLLLQNLRWEKYVSIDKGMREVDTIQTSNFMMKRAVFNAIGGFDRSFKRVEDADLCYRLRKKGYRLILNFDSAVVHNSYGGHGAYNMVKKMITDYYYRMKFQVKHFGLLGTNPLAVFDFNMPVKRKDKM